MGKVIIHNRYELIGIIGQGGMGKVYLAMDLESNLRVAIKECLLRKDQDNAALIQRIQREYYFMLKIQHSSIVKAIDFFIWQNNYYIVMEYIEGITLESFIKKHKGISLSDKIEIAIKICDVISVLNENDIIHRDIKPSNIMMKNHHPILLDLGIAKAINMELTTLTKTGSIIGTPEYMSPEQLSGEVKRNSDVFSVGVVLYQLFLSLEKSPFYAGNFISSMDKIANLNLPPIASADEKNQQTILLSKLIEKCLLKDFNIRISSVNMVLKELKHIQSQKVIYIDERYEVQKVISHTAYLSILIAFDSVTKTKVLLYMHHTTNDTPNINLDEMFIFSKVPSEIVKIQNFSMWNSKIYIAYDYLEGYPLAKMIEEREIKPKHAAQICYCILSFFEHTLKYKKPSWTIHPENILITKDREIKVIPVINELKFMRAISFEETAKHYYYLPFECLIGKPNHTSFSYIVGAILYHIISKKAPFAEVTDLQNLKNEKELYFSPQLNMEGIPKKIVEIIEKAMSSRYQSPQEMRDALNTFIETCPASEKTEVTCEACNSGEHTTFYCKQKVSSYYKLHDYVVLEKVQQNKYSTSLKAIHPQLSNFAFIYILDDFSRNDIWLDTISKAQKIKHLQIKPIIGNGIFKEHPYYIILHNDEKTIAEDIKTRLYSEEKAIFIIKQIVEIIDYVHLLGLSYGALLNIENIFIDNNGKVKLGELKPLEYFDEKNLIMPIKIDPGDFLSIKYSSPEYLLELDLDFRGDIFSIGVLFYSMLTGISPFAEGLKKDDYLFEIANIVQKDVETLVKSINISRKSARIICKMLKKDKKERYQNCKEILKAIE